jgi:hypothetical protein
MLENEGFVDGCWVGENVGCVDKLGTDDMEGEVEG